MSVELRNSYGDFTVQIWVKDEDPVLLDDVTFIVIGVTAVFSAPLVSGPWELTGLWARGTYKEQWGEHERHLELEGCPDWVSSFVEKYRPSLP